MWGHIVWRGESKSTYPVLAWNLQGQHSDNLEDKQTAPNTQVLGRTWEDSHWQVSCEKKLRGQNHVKGGGVECLLPPPPPPQGVSSYEPVVWTPDTMLPMSNREKVEKVLPSALGTTVLFLQWIIIWRPFIIHRYIEYLSNAGQPFEERCCWKEVQVTQNIWPVIIVSRNYPSWQIWKSNTYQSDSSSFKNIAYCKNICFKFDQIMIVFPFKF